MSPTRKNFLALTAGAVAAPAFLRRAEASVSYPTMTIKVSHEVPVGFPNDIALKKWANTVAQRSGGAITVQIFPSGQLFNDQNALATILTSRGQTVQMVSVTPFYLATYEPSVGVYMLPFAIQSAEGFRTSLSSRPGNEIRQRLAKKGLRVIGDIIDGGSLFVVNRLRPITQPSDLRGLKVRTLGGKIADATLEALGTSVVSLPAPSVALALGQGTIDGSVSTYPFWNAALSGVAKYGTDPGMLRTGWLQTVSEEWWNTLNEPTRTLLSTTLEQAIRTSWHQTEAALGIARDGLKAKGNQLTLVTGSQRQVWKAHVQPVYDKFAPEIGNAIVDGFAKQVR